MDHFHNNEKIKECMIATLSLLYESATYTIFVLQMTKFKLKKTMLLKLLKWPLKLLYQATVARLRYSYFLYLD